MAYPMDPSEGFLRTPTKYPHDAFGHDGAVDGCSRIRPHTGNDSTPRVKDATARTVLGGRVGRADYTIYAGNYVVVEAPDGWLWLDLHLQRRLVRPGHILAEGDAIGVVGNTGGGGSGPLAGVGKLGTHLHTSRCKDYAAVDRIVNGLVRRRGKGESAERWAAAMGLSDPYPHILKSLETSKASGTSADAPNREGFLMALTDKQQARMYAQVEAIRAAQIVPGAGYTYDQAIFNLVQGLYGRGDGAGIDVDALAAQLRVGLGNEIAAELARRLAR